MELPKPSKPYAEQSTEERLASLDKIQNVMLHADWRELYLRWHSDRNDVQRQMDEAHDWETFVAARAIRLYIDNHLLNLREMVAGEVEDLTAVKQQDALIHSQGLSVPEYEDGP